MNKYVILYDEIGINLTFMKWQVGDEQKLLIFDTKTSATRFIDTMLHSTSLFDFSDMDYCQVIEVKPEIQEVTDYLNATNLIPVANGDDIELKEVKD